MLNLVILSAVAAAQSAAAAESKDPIPACGASSSGRGSYHFDKRIPGIAVATANVMGSFDCVVLRCAHDNFAQDDRGEI